MTYDLEPLLRRAGLRSTTPRKSVFAVLKNATRPLTTSEIIKTLPKTDKVSIYRTIDTFLRLGIITTVPQGWKPHYELASPLKPHHHHLFCNNCSRLIDVHTSDLEETITNVAKQHRFLVQAHSYEISGLCENCQATRPTS